MACLLLECRYNLFERDTMHNTRHLITHTTYNLLILDEGHCIKNSTSKRFQVPTPSSADA